MANLVFAGFDASSRKIWTERKFNGKAVSATNVAEAKSLLAAGKGRRLKDFGALTQSKR
jgi:hypothetical protein